ncbi:MAG: adenosylmethionine--8-amino-7-oxononanoate transaminase [Gammaproteobacteria bacterium]|nr:adenosylmethionine--8-amino-7-oxononanoate transaminase [Gammaproteobacteria bacterium]
MVKPIPAYPVASASGVRLKLEDGRQLIDGMSSWWSAIHGYNHPRLNAAAETQLADMSHVMFGGLTHRPAAELAARLIELTPAPLNRVFFSDSGSVAVEVALKMALQYWQARGETRRTRFLSFRGGYHGDTIGAMAVSDPENGLHSLFSGTLTQQLFAPRPPSRASAAFDSRQLEQLRKTATDHREELAGIIIEPLVQGAGGMHFYHPDYLRELRQLCDQQGLLLIFDEIATGFGRTGSLFATEQAGVVPDIICLGKALTGGYMSLAATLTREAVASGICQGDPGVFMHGPTFMANPLACAVASASIDLLLESPWRARVQTIEQGLQAGLIPVSELPGVADVRVLGAIGVVEMKQPLDVTRTQAALVERGVWLRPFGKLLYTMPPYIIDSNDLAHLTDTMCEVVELVAD